MTTKDGTYFPDYARMHKKGESGGTVLKFSEFRSGYAAYYKVCGDWYAYFRYKDGILTCTNTPHGSEITKYMRGSILTECTKEEFKEDNPYGIHELHERQRKMEEEWRKENTRVLSIYDDAKVEAFTNGW